MEEDDPMLDFDDEMDFEEEESTQLTNIVDSNTQVIEDGK